jgi:hypothetical protein
MKDPMHDYFSASSFMHFALNHAGALLGFQNSVYTMLLAKYTAVQTHSPAANAQHGALL